MPSELPGRLTAALRAASVPPFHAMEMGRRASERQARGGTVLHLELGQPSAPLPLVARQAVARHLEAADPMGYTNAAGLMSLRRALAARYDNVPAERIMVVAGASAGFTLAFLAAFDAGQRVGVLEPGYPCYRNTLLALGCEPIAIPIGPDTGWAPTPALLDAAGPLDGLIIASPSNPTGTVLSSSTLAEITTWCAAQGTQLIADEIYHGLTYDAPATTVLQHTADAVVINSFSKYYAMTGWRLGWMVVPDHLMASIERLQQNLYICASHVAQIAGLAALDATEELDRHVDMYAANRAVLLDGLRAAGFTEIARPDGAFYLYTDASHLTARTAAGAATDSLALCGRWLDELGVCVTPGIDFDLARGDRFVRFSYAGAQADIVEACERLQTWRP